VSASTIRGTLTFEATCLAALATSVSVVIPRSGRARRFENPAPEKYNALKPVFSASFATEGLKTPGATTILSPPMSFLRESA
jgi:hypothetical protein